MTLIELGEISSGSSPEPPAAPPRRVDIRRIAVLLVAVLTVLTVTGSERPEPRGLPPLWTAPSVGEQFVLTADTLYVLGTADGPELIAYDAADGTVRWRRAQSKAGYWINTEVPGLVLVPDFTEQDVTDENGNTYTEPVVTSTTALDPATGREVWRAPGEASLWSGDLVQMSIRNERSAGVSRFRTVRRSDGRVVWEFTPEKIVSSWTATGTDPGRTDRFITGTDDGTVEVRRMDTGALIVRKKLPWLLPEAQPGAYAQLFSARSVLYVMREDRGEQVVDAYQPETLSLLWSRRLSMFNNFFECGGMVCINTGQGSVEAIAPATGKSVWTSQGWDYAREIAPGRLLTEVYQGGFSGLIDARDGHRIAEFADGSHLVDRANGRIITVGANLTAPPGAPISQPLDDNTVIMRGLVGPVADFGCQYAAGRLACSVQGGRLVVTDVG